MTYDARNPGPGLGSCWEMANILLLENGLCFTFWNMAAVLVLENSLCFTFGIWLVLYC
jgi:hypothetical protein